MYSLKFTLNKKQLNFFKFKNFCISNKKSYFLIILYKGKQNITCFLQYLLKFQLIIFLLKEKKKQNNNQKFLVLGPLYPKKLLGHRVVYLTFIKTIMS